MSDSADLMRWNRAGLSELEYTEGNAASFLEDLRLELRKQFSLDEDVLGWLGEETKDKNLKAWQERLIEQYHQERRDYAWEILRTYSRASHVLNKTISTFGNERFIRTATQWENVRKLVNMLDYHPAPPASAETYLALFAKSDEEATGTVDSGLAVKNQPSDGTNPIIFESLQPLLVDYRLNALRGLNYNRSSQFFIVPDQHGLCVFLLDEIPEGVSVGDRGILSNQINSVAIEIDEIHSESLTLKIIENGFSSKTWALADLRLHLFPDFQETPLLNDTSSFVYEIDKANGALKTGSVVAYKNGGNWYVNKIEEISGTRVKLNTGAQLNRAFYMTTEVKRQNVDGSSRFVLPENREQSSGAWKADLTSADIDHEDVKNGPGKLYDYVAGSATSKVFYVAKGTPVSFRIVNLNPEKLQFEGDVDGLISGGALLLKNSAGEWYSNKVNKTVELEEGFYLEMSGYVNAHRWVQVEGNFTTTLFHSTYDQNTNDLYHSVSDTNCQLTLLLDEFPEALVPGRKLWVVGPEDCELVTLQEVLDSDLVQGSVTLSVKPSLSGLSFPKYDTWIYGNVVKFGHGETRAQNILGNGNRIEKNQHFIYKKSGIAFEQDLNFSSGVRPSISLTVDNRKWTAVDTLRNSTATETHYETELNEDAEMLIRFGDGIHGQRLPTGTNNVKIQARFGSGSKGNLVAESLDKLKKPHSLVEKVIQPADAYGGGDMENTESLRELAPASVLTLNRAVSLSDYGFIAQRHSSVWQAKSFSLPDIPGATDCVEVVLVPVGGGDLGDLADTMKNYLENFSRPGVNVFISRYHAILLFLQVVIRVDTEAYDGDEVTENVRLSLIDEFSLEKAKLGDTLYRSRVYEVIEKVEGVENVDVLINAGGFIDEQGFSITPGDVYLGEDNTVRRITPEKNQVIYLNSEMLSPEIIWELADV